MQLYPHEPIGDVLARIRKAKPMLLDGDIFEYKDKRFVVTFPYDDNCDPPWDREDGHGPVSEWTTRDKLPGELVLSADRHNKRFYHFGEACRIALRDGWGYAGMHDGETPRQRAAAAARADYERLRKWCDNQWSYIGVVVHLVDEDDQPLSEYHASVLGIESDRHEYLDETARELAEEILTEFEGMKP